MISNQWKTTTALAAAMACAAGAAEAQSLVSTSPNVIAASGVAVPGAPGVTWSLVSSFDNPVMDASGSVLFRGKMTGTGIVTVSERALFSGTSYATLVKMIQAADPAPTLPGVTLQTATLQGLGGSPRLSANGQTFWGSSLLGTGVVTTNDTAIFGGPVGSFTVFTREGDLAPSGGSTMTTAVNNLSHQPTGMIDSGRILFQTTLAGGDVSGTTNNSAWVSGLPGALQWVERKGDTELGGCVISALGFISQMNPAGLVLHDESLSTTLGATPATVANDKVLFIWTPGGGNAKVVREGDTAPGTAGGTFNTVSNTWSVSGSANCFNRDGKVMFQAAILGGTMSDASNDTGYFIGDASGLSLALQEGAPAPGTDGNFVGLHSSNFGLNNNGRIAFQSSITGGTTTAANDTGLWAGVPGSLELVLREGDPAPGLPGEFIGNVSGQVMQFNDQGQVIVNNTPTGGSGLSAIFGWTPGVGLQLVSRGGESVEVQPTVFKTISSAGGIQFNNGDGTGLSFAGDGTIALKVTFTDTTDCVLTVKLPTPPIQTYCDPGVNGALACPCSNPASNVGRGCDNSDATGGASIVGSGTASLAGDTVVLTTAGERASATSIVLSGTIKTTGAVFGQGVRCVGGGLKRLYTKLAVAGSVTAPELGDASLSAQAASLSDTIVAGEHRFYMVYYRDPLVLGGCPVANTFNGTNAVDVTWSP